MTKVYKSLLFVFLLTVFEIPSALGNTYTIKVRDTASSEEKTYKVTSLKESFKIPLPYSDTNCFISQDVWKTKQGGAGLNCTKPDSGFGITTYINCSDVPYIATQLFLSIDEEIKYRKKKGLKIPEDLKTASKDLMTNQISIKVGCNIVMD